MSFFKKFNNLDAKRKIFSVLKRFSQAGANVPSINGWGNSNNDSLGASISINAAGDKLAVGVPNWFNMGRVITYSWNGSAWRMTGAMHGNSDLGDNFGASISMNAAGNRIVIGNPNTGSVDDPWMNELKGKVRAYYFVQPTPPNFPELTGDVDQDNALLEVYYAELAEMYPPETVGDFYGDKNWLALGQQINGEENYELTGSSVSMNAVGDRIAVGARWKDVNGMNRGQVRLYQLNGANWTQLGGNIDGEAASDEFGSSISMNAVGDRIVIGAPRNDGNGADSGSVRIYSWNGSDWALMGIEINGNSSNDRFGTSVSMNAAGDKIAIGAPNNDQNGADSGQVRLYQWDGANWTQLGTNINGEAAGDQFGASVSMNAVGGRVAIGAPYNNGNGADSGHFRLYEWNGTAWVQLVIDIDGDAAGDYLSTVSINAAGNRVAVGMSGKDAINAESSGGGARVYHIW